MTNIYVLLETGTFVLLMFKTKRNYYEKMFLPKQTNKQYLLVLPFAKQNYIALDKIFKTQNQNVIIYINELLKKTLSISE